MLRKHQQTCLQASLALSDRCWIQMGNESEIEPPICVDQILINKML